MDRAFDHLVFDLDDTLLDTFGQLVPNATREACEAMIQAGLNADLDLCVRESTQYRSDSSRGNLFAHLLQHFGARAEADTAVILREGQDHFYQRKVERDIQLLPGAKHLLEELRKNYNLHLVTSGSRPTQEMKIQILEIEKFFTSIHHVDPLRGETKNAAFRAIMNATQSPAVRYLSIGNRVDTDIGEASVLGWKTCWVRYGEYQAMHPISTLEEADFQIGSIGDLIRQCQL